MKDAVNGSTPRDVEYMAGLEAEVKRLNGKIRAFLTDANATAPWDVAKWAQMCLRLNTAICPQPEAAEGRRRTAMLPPGPLEMLKELPDSELVPLLGDAGAVGDEETLHAVRHILAQRKPGGKGDQHGGDSAT